MLHRPACKILLIEGSKALHLETKNTSHISRQKGFRSHGKQTTEQRLKHKTDLGILAEEQLSTVPLHNAISNILIQSLDT